MTATLAPDRTATAVERQFATFYVGHMLLGVDIRIVQEIPKTSVGKVNKKLIRERECHPAVEK